jgi:fumarate reductase flavoprotein subunit
MEISLANAESLQADVVVIGAGAAGLVAAVAAAEGGAHVLIFEKTNTPGGPLSLPPSMKGPPGLFAVESKLQRRKYVGLSKDEAFRSLMDYSHWRANARLVRAYVNKSADTIEWLEQQGAAYTEESPLALFAGSHFVWHVMKVSSQDMVKILVAKAEEKRVEMRFATAVSKITKDGGRVTGVIAEDTSGKSIKATAKAVIIATGGYANNQEMIKKYTGFDLGRNLIYANPYRQEPGIGLTGDGIRMAQEVGAAEEGLGNLILTVSLPGPGGSDTQLRAMARQPYLWVNQEGKRFCGEDIIRHWPYAGNAIAKQKGGYAFLIYDENTKRHFEEEGLDNGFHLYLLPPTTRIVDLDAQLEACRAKGNENMYVANSLEDLSNKIGIKTGVLKNTVNEYNTFCEKNHDDLFVKDPKFLHPVKAPKFYAFRLFPSFFATVGGIKINDKTEVLNKEGEVISGLYAVGNDSNALYGDSYDLWLPGTGFGFAFVSAHIAGEYVSKYIHK